MNTPLTRDGKKCRHGEKTSTKRRKVLKRFPVLQLANGESVCKKWTIVGFITWRKKLTRVSSISAARNNDMVSLQKWDTKMDERRGWYRYHYDAWTKKAFWSSDKEVNKSNGMVKLSCLTFDYNYPTIEKTISEGQFPDLENLLRQLNWLILGRGLEETRLQNPIPRRVECYCWISDHKPLSF